MSSATEIVSRHLHTYGDNAKASAVKLEGIWTQLDISPSDQLREVADIAARAAGVWAAAVEEAEAQRIQARDAVEVALHEIAVIKRQLGDAGDQDDLPVQVGGASSRAAWLGGACPLCKLPAPPPRNAPPTAVMLALLYCPMVKTISLAPRSPRLPQSEHKTLRAWLQEAQEKREVWMARRTQRLAEHEDMQARLRHARSLIGQAQPALPSPPDISRANMEFLKLELEKLAAEKVREAVPRRWGGGGACERVGEGCAAPSAGT